MPWPGNVFSTVFPVLEIKSCGGEGAGLILWHITAGAGIWASLLRLLHSNAAYDWDLPLRLLSA